MSSNRISNFSFIFIARIRAQGNSYDVLITQPQFFLAKPNVLEHFASSKIKLNAALDTQPSNSEYKKLSLYMCSKTVWLPLKLVCILDSWVANILFISSQHVVKSPTYSSNIFSTFHEPIQQCWLFCSLDARLYMSMPSQISLLN